MGQIELAGGIVSEGKSGNLIKSDYVRKAYLGL